MQVRLIGKSKLEVNVNSGVSLCVSLATCPWCSPPLNIRLQQTLNDKQVQLMDGWMTSCSLKEPVVVLHVHRRPHVVCECTSSLLGETELCVDCRMYKYMLQSCLSHLQEHKHTVGILVLCLRRSSSLLYVVYHNQDHHCYPINPSSRRNQLNPMILKCL